MRRVGKGASLRRAHVLAARVIARRGLRFAQPILRTRNQRRLLEHYRAPRIRRLLDRIDDVAALRTRLVGEGVFLRPFGNVVYLTPAFTIAPNDLEKLIGAIVKVIRSL